MPMPPIPNEQNMNSNSTQRRTVFDGEVHKCPNCGELLTSFVVECPSCGYEIRGKGVTNSVQQFASELSQASDDKQKETIIRSFPIPNTKEDIFDFLILASSNIERGVENELSKAWLVKVQQCYQKAKMLFGDSNGFESIQEIYDSISKGIREDKKKAKVRSTANLVIQNVLVVIGIIALIVSIFIDSARATSGTSEMVQAIGCIVLIATAVTLPKRNAILVDYGITALAGVVTILLSFLLDNGSMLLLCGGITIVIVAVNFFKAAPNKR